MKHKQKLLTGLFALSLATTLSAQQITISQNVVFALTETYSAPALPDRNEFGVPIRGAEPVFSNTFSVTNTSGQTMTTTEEGSKMVAARISNKEILLDLVEEKVIESIIGYSIQLRGEPDDDGNVDTKFYLVKRGETPIDITEHLSIDESDDSYGEAENYSYRKVEVSAPARETITGRANGKEQVSLKYASSSVEIEMDGIGNWSESYRNLLLGPSLIGFWAPGSGSVTSIAGKLTIKETTPSDDSAPSLIEGKITVGGGVISVNPL